MCGRDVLAVIDLQIPLKLFILRNTQHLEYNLPMFMFIGFFFFFFFFFRLGWGLFVFFLCKRIFYYPIEAYGYTLGRFPSPFSQIS